MNDDIIEDLKEQLLEKEAEFQILIENYNSAMTEIAELKKEIKELKGE